MSRDKADELYSIVVKRYQQERPEVILSNADLDSIWYSVYGELNRNGYDKALEYAKTAELSIGKEKECKCRAYC